MSGERFFPFGFSSRSETGVSERGVGKTSFACSLIIGKFADGFQGKPRTAEKLLSSSSIIVHGFGPATTPAGECAAFFSPGESGKTLQQLSCHAAVGYA
jgi:hypothetical protein